MNVVTLGQKSNDEDGVAQKPLWIGNIHFPHGWVTDQTVKEVLALITKAAKHREHLLAKLKTAGKSSKASNAQAAYLGSTLVRLDALIRAAKRLDYDEKLEVPQYEQIASQLKLYQPISEPVRVYLKKKSGNGYRYFCHFGVRHQAAQALVADMINAQFQAKPFQYNTRGQGVAEAVKKIRQLYATGNGHFVRLDIKSFFDSFDHKATMQALPIAKDVTEHVALGKHYQLHGQKLSKEETPLQETLNQYISLIAEHGLPQGSACSPAIANFFVSKIEPKLPKGARFLNYVDDFLILAQSPERAQKAKNALTSSIEEMSVGKFELLEKSSGSLHSEVEFLGHVFIGQPDGTFKVAVSPANVHKIMAWTAKEYESVTDKFKADQGKDWVSLNAMSAAVRFAHHIMSWLSTFSQADDVGKHQKELFERIATFALATGQDTGKIVSLAKNMPLKDVGSYSG
ncbi:reverse transcriptase domain-containing protein [Mesorhizobium sp. 131-2-1]|uniref:reverse transcriptase domain-containing protein n=1 Tax=Mesorhizobium sp. 131-2-1 TaxID=2744518 RepID=UPI001FD47BEB|nr:reverse transcriptase domain-containing protein [Mesorhizobium sp. 131-2-1]